MKETPAPFRVAAITSFGPLLRPQPLERLRKRAHVVPVAAPECPAEGLDLRFQVAEVAHLGYPRVRLDLVAVDDDGDLLQAAVRGRLQRLPDLPLLQLPVSGEDVDVARAAEQPVGEDEAARLRDPHPERARARDHLRRGGDVGVAGQAVQPPQLMDQVEVQPAERGEEGVQAGSVVALGGEVAVALAEHLQVQPGDDVERAEGGAEMARADAPDHVEDVQPAGIGEGGRPLVAVALERADPVELGPRDVPQLHVASLLLSMGRPCPVIGSGSGSRAGWRGPPRSSPRRSASRRGSRSRSPRAPR